MRECQSTPSARATPRNSPNLLWTSPQVRLKIRLIRTQVRCRLLGDRAAYGAVARERKSCRKSGARRSHVRLPLCGGVRMTAEIAILNKSAVALAADSKVTIGSSGSKTFDTVNKIFTISKIHPVGLMIFGNAEFMRYPWETVVKLYRENKGPSEHGTISDWADDFLSFISRFGAVTSHEIDENFNLISTSIFQDMRDTIRRRHAAGSIVTLQGACRDYWKIYRPLARKPSWQRSFFISQTDGCAATSFWKTLERNVE
jgi:hypothetical protein